jgi:LemA protein
MILFVIACVIGLILAYFILIYNSLVDLKHQYGKEWAQIDVILKQRHDELPKLVETCKAYMKHEQETLEKVINARAQLGNACNQKDIPAVNAAENLLRTSLSQLYLVAENYPQLKANESFKFLQTRISQLESEIADRREEYNESVNTYNVRIEQFPDKCMAKHYMKLKPATLLIFSPEEIKDVEIKF